MASLMDFVMSVRNNPAQDGGAIGGGLSQSRKALGAIGMLPESFQAPMAFGLLPSLLGPSALFGTAIPMMMRRSAQEPSAEAASTSPVAPTASFPASPPMPPPRPAMPAAMPPMPPPRPSAPMPLPSAAPAPSVRQGFMQRLLGGPVYQSTGGTLIAQPQGAMPTTGAPMAPVMTPTRPQDINWGDPNNPADFVRADQALRGLGLLG